MLKLCTSVFRPQTRDLDAIWTIAQDLHMQVRVCQKQKCVTDTHDSDLAFKSIFS